MQLCVQQNRKFVDPLEYPDPDDVLQERHGVVPGLDVLDLGQDVDGEPVRLPALPVAAVHVVAAGQDDAEDL